MSLIFLSTIALLLISVSIFVWRASSSSPINRWFAISTSCTAFWILAITGAHSGRYEDFWGRLSFAFASLIPVAFLAFMACYPSRGPRLSPHLVWLGFGIAVTLSALSLSTDLVAFNFTTANGEPTRHTGPLYSLFVLYFLMSWLAATVVMFGKLRASQGAARRQIQYLATGISIFGACAITTNLVLPFLTGRSTYTWLGPMFGVVLIALIAHAIIRHRLMDVRIVIHRGLTVTIAMLVSLLPAATVFLPFWSRLSDRFEPEELALLLVASTIVCFLVPPTRDFVGKILDRYLYRSHANYRQTVRDTSRALTRVLDLKVILSLVSNALVSTIECEGVAIYLRSETGFSRATIKKRRESWLSDAPDAPPESVTSEIVESRDAIVGKDLSRNGTSPKRGLHGELARLNWSLVLPLLSEDKVIGFIAVAPKLSGDPFYPHDLDLLMTLAHQAGIAIKNAQLYTQVVLANEYIENIVGTIESGVVAVDAGGRVTMFNRAAEQLTGLGADAVKQESVEALPAALGVLLKATVGDGVERTEPEIVLPDGTTTRPVICTTSPLLDPAGAILGAVAVFSDLTPFKQLENERRRAERLAYFEILASSLAHEIKNPLVAIKTFTQLITRRHHDENFVAEFSRVVTREVNRMERLVERLRALSRPRDGRRTPVDVREPLRQAVEFLRPAFDEKRITITMSPGDGAATVLGDANELEQLFLNLLMNAHEATPPEGSVSAEISVSGTTVAVAVSDSGPGIPTDLLDHVFDPFITTKPRGSGLGLTISAGIATTHHARLWAANRPGGGALFQVDFPVAVQADTPREIADTNLTPVRAPRTPSDLP